MTPQELNALYAQKTGVQGAMPSVQLPQNDAFQQALKAAQANKEARLASQPAEQPQGGLLTRAFNAVTGSEQAFGRTIGGALATSDVANKIVDVLPFTAQSAGGVSKMIGQEAGQDVEQHNLTLQAIQKARAEGRTEEANRLAQGMAQRNLSSVQAPTLETIIPESQKSARQIFGEGAGVAADIASAGLFGKGANAARTGQLLTGSQKVAGMASKANIPFTGVTQAVKAPLLQRAGALAKEGATLGGLYGGSQQAQQDASAMDILKGAAGGATIGGLLGGSLPVAGASLSKIGQGAPKVGGALAVRTMDSLIKPLVRDLKYLKNPSRGLIKEGIVFNSLEEGAQKAFQRSQEIGAEIGARLKAPENAAKKLDLSNALTPLDTAISEAKKSPRINSALIKRLEDTKADILGIDEATGLPTRQLKDLSPEQAFELKKIMDSITKYTGNASDDTVTNKALQESRKQIKDLLNENVAGLAELNERYGDLITASKVMQYRDKIVARQNIFPLASKIGTIGGVLTGAVTLNPLVIAATIANFGFEKAMSSAAFKSRLAQWLAKASPAQKSVAFGAVPGGVKTVEKMIGVGSELETKATEQVKKNSKSLISAYQAKHGKVINNDDFKSLFEPIGYNGLNAAQVHEPASALTKQYYERVLSTAKPGDTGVFLGGGAGSGKTSATSSILDFDKDLFVYDGTFANFDSAMKKIKQAESVGVKPKLIYVYREPVDAWINGVVPRAKRTNRIVPLKIFVEDTAGALQTFKKLQSDPKYAGRIDLIDNSLGQDKQAIMGLDKFNKLSYTTPVRKQLYDQLLNKTKELYDAGAISKELYDALVG